MTEWSEEQVAKLNKWQQQGQYHPFTCPGDYPECENQRELVATQGGWACRCGKYKQDWAHSFMFEPKK